MEIYIIYLYTFIPFSIYVHIHICVYVSIHTSIGSIQGSIICRGQKQMLRAVPPLASNSVLTDYISLYWQVYRGEVAGSIPTSTIDQYCQSTLDTKQSHQSDLYLYKLLLLPQKLVRTANLYTANLKVKLKALRTYCQQSLV